ncbi:hypothetical protein ACGFIY_02385 [Micromonospora chersina]|uniref:hypothetical protein n=1 Tax=Micromonospora chersina TaxID=47854 RepID=UPI003717606A
MRLKALAASLAAAVGLSMIQPTPASAAEPDPGAAANKIESSLKDRFRAQPASDFWITFDTKPDLGPAKKIADWTARGQFVYDALTAAAKGSLASVSADLDRAGVKYTSYPIANTVLVRGGHREARPRRGLEDAGRRDPRDAAGRADRTRGREGPR